MKSFFSKKYNNKFFENFSNQANKNFINFSNSYFMLNLRNIINTSILNNSFEISKLVMGLNKNRSLSTNESTNAQLDPLGGLLIKLNEFSILAKSNYSI